MTLTEKVAYIKGLMDGLEIDTAKKEGKVLAAIVDLLNDMAEDVSVLTDTVDELDEQIGLIDEDLDAVEGYVYGDEDDEEEYEVECPSCGNVFYIDEITALEGETVCPDCGEEIEVEIDDDDDDDDCDCDDECDCGCCDSH